MANKLEQFIQSSLNGTARQCVVFVNDWLRFLGRPTINEPTAIDFTSAPQYIAFKAGVTRFHPGDILVFRPQAGNPDGIDPIGHVAVAVRDLGNGLVKVISANFGPGSNLGAGTSPKISILHIADLAGFIPEQVKGFNWRQGGTSYGPGGISGTNVSWNKIPEQIRQYRADFVKVAKSNPVWEALLAAQIVTEDASGNAHITNRIGAEGLAQFLPGTWTQVAREVWGKNAGKHSPFNPLDAITAQRRYISDLLKQTGGDLRRALFLYSGGSTTYADPIIARTIKYLQNPKKADKVSGTATPQSWGQVAGRVGHDLFSELYNSTLGALIAWIKKHPVELLFGAVAVLLLFGGVKGLTTSGANE